MNEPSVLDFVRSWLDPRQKEKIYIPSEDISHAEVTSSSIAEVEVAISSDPKLENEKPLFPKFILGAFTLFLVGQALIEFGGSAGAGAMFFALAIGGMLFGIRRGEISLEKREEIETGSSLPLRLDLNFLISLGFAAAAFFAFGSLRFNIINTALWLASIFFFFRGTFICPVDGPKKTKAAIKRIFTLPWEFTITKQVLITILAVVIILFFRFWDLSGVPGEPFSDHAEKLLDVSDVLAGEWKLFFPRNTGREFIQFFLTALIAKWTGLGLSFMSLKLGTALIGLFTLPFVYLFGTEIGGKRLGFIAMFFAGISYWLNVISRIGLRFPLYPAFAAPALYFLIRGLKRDDRNAFLFSGLFLGLGLHGYSPFRIVPIAVVAGITLFFLARPSTARWQKSVESLFLIGMTSFLVFVPLLRVVVSEPMIFSYRALTRMTGIESAITEPAWWLFLKNNWNAMLMFNVNNGIIWVHSIPNRPALDIATGALFLFGVVYLIFRTIRNRDWIDIYLLVLIPIFLLPSTLSIAFPSENPSLNRTGAAAVIVFLIAAIGLNKIHSAAREYSRKFAGLLISAVLILSMWQNYGLVFGLFKQQFLNSALNTSEIGMDIRYFTDLGNDIHNAHVVPYPYWVDTRLAGIQAGFPEMDMALASDRLEETLLISGAQLFIFKEDDIQTRAMIASLYPNAYFELRTSKIPNKNYWIARTRQ